ncbi:hypothetical protein DFH09DRAFT_1424898 [Mycena vulgaris]|nr:hypothetical protein DFH09DRAFT_1424898 [Mycena vulgaris]
MSALSLPACYGLPRETWDQIIVEVILKSPRRLCRLAAAMRPLSPSLITAELWLFCFLHWFGRNPDLPILTYRAKCFDFVRYFNGPEFVAARMLASAFAYSPMINYPEEEVLPHINARHPNISHEDLEKAFVLATPFFENSALRNGDKWNHAVQHFRTGSQGRYRQLYRVASRPYPLPSPTPIIFSIFLPSIPARKPSLIEKGRKYFTVTLPIYKTHLDTLVSASCAPYTTKITIPICLPSMPELKKLSPSTWLERTLENVAAADEYLDGLAPLSIGLDDATLKLRGAKHLQHILDSGAHQRDILLLFYHPAADPLPALEDWTDLLENLSPMSAIGYCFPAALSVANDWDTTIFGADGLDYSLSIHVGTLKLVRQWLAVLVPPRTLKKMSSDGSLVGWLTGHGLGAPEAARLDAIVDRSGSYRRLGAAYKGDNRRIAGEAVPPSWSVAQRRPSSTLIPCRTLL